MTSKTHGDQQTPMEHEPEKNTVSSTGHLNAQETENSSRSGKIIEYEHVENTPFTIVTYNSDKFDDIIVKRFIAVGNNRVSDDFETVDDAKEDIKNNIWVYLPTVIAIVVDKILTDQSRKLNKEMEEMFSKPEYAMKNQ